MSLTDLTIEGALAGLAAGDFSSVEVTSACLDRIAANKPLNAFVTVTPEIALAAARASDARRKAGRAGALEGVPLAIKDLFCTRGVPAQACSNILAGFTPTYESTVTANLWNEGAVQLGKVNMDEFAMGSSNATSCHGPAINPWGEDDRVPGGSSGGSAVAVAAHLALGATGTDTGGSIRQPASFCGITGIKPTYGRCSRWGMIAFASSLDQAGPMARTVRDCALMLGAMAGHDAKDSTSVDQPVPDWAGALSPSVRGKRIGIPAEYDLEGLDGAVKALWEQGMAWLKAEGAEIVDITLPHTRYALPTYYIIAPAEASSNLARYDGVRYGKRVAGDSLIEMYENSRAAGFGDEVKRRIMIGTYTLSAGYYDAYYVKAQKVRSLIARDFVSAFGRVDAILTPTAPSAAFRLNEQQDDPIQMYLNDVFTVPVSLAGLPAISVPAGLSGEGLPLGLQVIGKAWDEQTVLDVGAAIEAAAGFPYL